METNSDVAEPVMDSQEVQRGHAWILRTIEEIAEPGRRHWDSVRYSDVHGKVPKISEDRAFANTKDVVVAVSGDLKGKDVFKDAENVRCYCEGTIKHLSPRSGTVIAWKVNRYSGSGNADVFAVKTGLRTWLSDKLRVLRHEEPKIQRISAEYFTSGIDRRPIPGSNYVGTTFDPAITDLYLKTRG